jgi:hypothetical protein
MKSVGKKYINLLKSDDIIDLDDYQPKMSCTDFYKIKDVTSEDEKMMELEP